MENNKKIILLVVIVFLLGVIAAYQVTRQKQGEGVLEKENSAREEKTGDKNVVEDKNNSASESESAEVSEAGITYFYGAECPHCKDVLDYLDKNDIYSKVNFVKKEVWHNKANGEELRKAALKCGLDPAKIGVPFVFSEGKCYMGGPDVMEFFGNKAGI